MANNEDSRNMYEEDQECVQIVGLNEQQEGTTETSMEEPMTQYLLEVEPAPEKKKKTKEWEKNQIQQ